MCAGGAGGHPPRGDNSPMATRRLAWLALGLAALVAVVGLASRAPRPLGVGGRTTPVGPGFFDYAFTTVVLVLAAELVLLVLLVASRARPGKFEPPKRAWWKQFVALGIIVLLLTALARVHPLHPRGNAAGGAKRGSSPLAQLQKRERGVHGRDVRLKWEELAVGGGILAAALLAGLRDPRRLRGPVGADW